MARISAVVCTYNRAASLRDTLRSLKRQEVRQGTTLDIIVVDNNSTDDTACVVEETARQIRRPVRYFRERNQGIGFARNRGLSAATGDVVAFIDDDVIVEAGWAQALTECFEQTGADMVAGKIVPLWLTDRPEWLRDELMGPITALNFGPSRKRLQFHQPILGANVAIRRVSAERFGPFDGTLGRRGTRWVGGEDLDMFQRWLRQGAVIFYDPAAVVRHKVEPERVTPQFYRRWFIDIGYTQGHQLEWKWHYGLSVMPYWRWAKLLKAGVRYAWTQAIPAVEARRFSAELWWLFQRSFLIERFVHWMDRWPGVRMPSCRFSAAR